MTVASSSTDITLDVLHDDDCGVFNGQSCTCVPDIRVEMDGEKWEIDDEGVPHKGR